MLRGLIAAVAASACGVSAEPVPFAVLAQGTQSGVEAERAVAIFDAAAFRSLWSEHVSELEPAPPVPSVDFSQAVVIAAFAGSRNTGGYGLSVAGVESKGDRLEVELVLTRPGTGCMVPQAITRPYVWGRLPKFSLPVAFHTSTVVRTCGSE